VTIDWDKVVERGAGAFLGVVLGTLILPAVTGFSKWLWRRRARKEEAVRAAFRDSIERLILKIVHSRLHPSIADFWDAWLAERAHAHIQGDEGLQLATSFRREDLERHVDRLVKDGHLVEFPLANVTERHFTYPDSPWLPKRDR